MAEREYLVVNVSYRRKNKITFVSSNYRMMFSNICQDELDAYLNELSEDGWELLRVNTWNDGVEQAYSSSELSSRDCLFVDLGKSYFL